MEDFRSSAILLNEGSGKDFVASLMNEINSHKALTHPYLVKLSKAEFSNHDEALRDYAHQYSFYSFNFTNYLEDVIKGLNNLSYQEALKENLKEELGDPNAKNLIDKPHVEIYRRFKEIIGVDNTYINDHAPTVTVKLWRELFMQKCKSEVPGVALGAIGLGTEYIVKNIYPYIIKAIKLSSNFHEDALLFFKLHLEADDEHSQVLLDITRDFCDDPNNREAVRFGAISSLNLRNVFWDTQLSRANKL